MIITIKNIHCKTTVGVYPAEKKRKQPLVVTLKIDYNEGKSGNTDNVKDTLNYHPIVDAVKKHIESNKFDLVEKAVEDIGKIVMSYSKVRSCEVEAAKTAGPIKFIDSFSVSKTFKRK